MQYKNKSQDRCFFIKIVAKIMKTVGSQISQNSDIKTESPRGVKKLRRPIGDTSIGRMGKKYRSLSKGQKKAMPWPPSVKASSVPCDTEPIKIIVKAIKGVAFNDFENNSPNIPIKRANIMEWVKPR